MNRFMKPFGMILAAVASVGIAASAAADHKARGYGCPPGLAKKNPPCVPPGLAKKGHIYGIGDRIGRDYIIIRNPERYGLDRHHTYYLVDDYVYRVDRETREVLDLIGLMAALLN